MASSIARSDSFVSFLPPPIPEPAPENMRKLFPGYTVDHLLGTGGFADVYRGVDKSGKDFALKIPKLSAGPGSVDQDALERFRAEAEIWMRLEHRNIVRLHDVSTEPIPHMAMELMEGGSLKQLMKKHRLEVGESVQIMAQLLEGLSYADKMASVHRDLKPENILFSSKGVAKITDWGIGKFMASESLTSSRDFKGTLSYSAPEQYNKKQYGNVDWQTDIFQIGVVFYKMLTGINPFKGEDIADCMGKVLMDRPEPPGSLNPDVPPELDEVIMGALRKRKEDRWGTDVMLYKLKEIGKKNIIRPRDKSRPSPRMDRTGRGGPEVTEVTRTVVMDSPADPEPPLPPPPDASNTVSSDSPTRKRSIFSISLITFILSIVGIFAVVFFILFPSIPPEVSISGLIFFGIAVGLAGIIFSAISMLKVRKYPEQYRGRKLAMIGIILGIILVIAGILGVIYIAIGT